MPDEVELPVVLDVDALLEPGSGGDPAELPAYAEFDASYNEARTAVAAGEPAGAAWRKVFAQGQELLGVGKSLEAAVRLTEAAASTHGFYGLHDGLWLLNGLIDRYWTGGDGGDGTSDDGATNLLPPLDNDDPDEPMDPLARVMRLKALAVYEHFGQAINAATLAISRGAGEVTLRLALAAEGKLKLTGDEAVPTPDQVRASLAAAAGEDPAAVAATLKAVRDARALAKRLTDAVDGLTDNAGPDLQPLDGWLAAAESARAPHVSEVAADTPAGDEAGVAAEAATDGAVAAGGAVGGGALRSRSDVERQLHQIVEWFDRHDPSSPVRELLLYSAKLLNMHFFEWQDEIGEQRELIEKLRAIRSPGSAEE